MIEEHLIDYDKCHEYARSLCGQRGIPACEAEDVGSDAYVEALKRAWRTTGVEDNPDALANRLMYTSVLNVINRRNTRASRIIREADDIDERRGDDDGALADDEAEETAILSAPVGPARSVLRTIPSRIALGPQKRRRFFGGYVAGRNPDDADWENPLWLRLFEYERQKLRNESRRTPMASITLRLIKAGLKDSRLSLLCETMQISWSHFQTILNFFQMRFGLCFQALRAWRAEI